MLFYFSINRVKICVCFFWRIMWRARLTSGRFHFATQAGDTKTWVLCGRLIPFCYRKAASFFFLSFVLEFVYLPLYGAVSTLGRLVFVT